MGSTTEEALLEAIIELRRVVTALNKVIEDDYPKRTEVAETYTTKVSLVRQVGILISLLIASLVFSFFAAISTISQCFLTAEPHPRACNIIPGYSSAETNQKELMEDYMNLRELVYKNNERLEKLERR